MFFVGQMSGLFENFNVRIYPDTIDVVNVKLCTMVLLTELYQFIPLSVTLTTFQGHSSVEQFEIKIVVSLSNIFETLYL